MGVNGGGGVPYIPPRYPVHFPGGQADAPWQASPPGIEPGSNGSKLTNLTTRPFGGMWTLHSIFNRRGPSLPKNCNNLRGSILFKSSSIYFQTNMQFNLVCSMMGYQHLAKLSRMMGCSATLLKPQ